MTTTEFDIYISEMQGRMLRFATTILHNKADAEDVVSQVCERLWRDRAKLEVKGSASAFAMTSVRNGCYDHHRYRQRHRHEEPSEVLPSEIGREEQSDTVELVRISMQRLPERQREVLHLKDIEGYSTHEIAEIFEIEETNVRMILSRARGALRDIIIKTMQQ
ncbi:MAG: sigma-70 family RNA polymerase sigma factor [Rikenellaceae bacterium]